MPQCTLKQQRIRRGSPRELSPEWLVVYRALPDKTFKNALTAFIYFLVRDDVRPDDVTDQHVAEFVDYLKAHDRNPAESIANSAIKWWSNIPGILLPPLKPYATMQSRRAAEWAALGPDIHQSIEGFVVKRASSLSDAGAHERSNLQLAARIVHDSTGPIASIDDLITNEAIDAIGDEKNKIKDTTRRAVLRSLRTYAQIESDGKPDEHRAEFLIGAESNLAAALREVGQTFSLPIETVRRLAIFDRSDVYDRLIFQCAEKVRRLRGTVVRKHDIPLAQAAMAAFLSLVKICKPGVVATLEFDGPTRVTDALSRPTLSGGLEAGLGPQTIALIDEFYLALREVLGRDPVYLCEKLSGGCRDQSGLGKDVRRLMAELGFDLCFGDLCLLGIKRLIDTRKYTPEAIADAAGYRTTANFSKVFGVWLDADAADELDEALL
jgi:hypothetical protein